MLSRIRKIYLCVGLALATALPAMAARTYVRGYYRKDGTYVRGHTRGSGSSLPRGDRSVSSPLAGETEVRGYYRRDGTYVRAHRRAPVNASAFKTLSFRQLGLEREGNVGEGAGLRNLRMPRGDLSKGSLPGVDLTGALLEGAVLLGANLEEAVLIDARLRGAVLAGALLSEADLIRTDLEGADLSGVSGVAARFDGAMLRKAILSNAELEDASFVGADLTGASLRNARLSHAHFQLANLEDADLQEADLRGADLSSARISKAQLKGALYSAATEWPDGFNPGGAGAVLKDVEGTDAVPGPVSMARQMLSLISSKLEGNDLSGAALLAGQLSGQLQIAKLRGAGEPGSPAATAQPVVLPSRAVLQTSPSTVAFPGGVQGKIHFPATTGYLLTGFDGGISGNVSSRVLVEVMGAIAVDNKLFKAGEQVISLTYASSNAKVVRIDDQGKIEVVGPGSAEVVVRSTGTEWRFPVRIVRLPITQKDPKETIIKKIGFPDSQDGKFWVWSKFPGLRLEVNVLHKIHSDWEEKPGEDL